MEVSTLRSESEEQTIELGEAFASNLVVGDVVAIFGDLGAGKTEFVKGICRYFAVDDIVTSPTFTIINQYAGETPDGDEIKIYHVDLYRIDSPAELDDVGFDDCVFAHDAIKLVEWPEKAQQLMPSGAWSVTITSDAALDNVRTITIDRQKAPVGVEKI